MHLWSNLDPSNNYYFKFSIVIVGAKSNGIFCGNYLIFLGQEFLIFS